CPCRIDFSRADALLIASSGSATSISFLRCGDFSFIILFPSMAWGAPGPFVRYSCRLSSHSPGRPRAPATRRKRSLHSSSRSPARAGTRGGVYDYGESDDDWLTIWLGLES